MQSSLFTFFNDIIPILTAPNIEIYAAINVS